MLTAEIYGVILALAVLTDPNYINFLTDEYIVVLKQPHHHLLQWPDEDNIIIRYLGLVFALPITIYQHGRMYIEGRYENDVSLYNIQRLIHLIKQTYMEGRLISSYLQEGCLIGYLFKLIRMIKVIYSSRKLRQIAT